MSFWGPVLGGLGLGAFGYKGAKDQNVASAAQAQRQMDFQREMSNTAIQRRMADLKAGGLNPILAGKHEASTPGGAMAPMVNRAAVALQNATSAANIQNIIANTNKTKEETRKIAFQADLGDIGSTAIDYTLDQIDRKQALANQYFRKDNWFNPDNYPNWFSSAREASRAYRPMDRSHLKMLIRESDIPFKDRHPSAKRADIRYKRNTKFARRKINLIKSNHPRNRRTR